MLNQFWCEGAQLTKRPCLEGGLLDAGTRRACKNLSKNNRALLTSTEGKITAPQACPISLGPIHLSQVGVTVYLGIQFICPKLELLFIDLFNLVLGIYTVWEKEKQVQD